MKKTDEEIIEKVKRGDKEEFGEIIDRYEKLLRSYAYRLVGNPDLVEDIVQEAFIKAYRDIWGFDTGRKFSSWIYRIVHNQAIDQFRKNQKLVNLEEFPEIAENRDLAQEIQEKIDNKKDKERLASAIKLLPEKYKNVIILKYFEEKDYEEISDILRIPVGTVGTLISRAKKKIRENLGREYE
jgi:RNA polymerase sigma-70 factor (ECF subfamily)